MALADVACDGRADHGAAQLQFGLVEVSLAHAYRSLGCLVGSDSVVEVELAGCILLVKRTDAFQIALRLLRLRFILLQLGTRLVNLSLILVLVDDKQYLVFLDISTFSK